MQNLIPTLKIDPYPLVVFILFALASFNISFYLSSRWMNKTKIELLESNLIVKSMIVLGGCFFISPLQFFRAPLLIQALSVPVGLGIGFFSVSLEKKLSRISLQKNQNSAASQMSYSETSSPHEQKIRPIQLFISSQEPLRRSIGLKKVIERPAVNMNWFTLMGLALLEEFIFRGFLLIIIQESISSYFFKTIAICAIIIIFGLAHLINATAQMQSKMVFASFTTVSFLLFDTLTASIIAHLYLNHTAFKSSKQFQSPKIVHI